MILMLSATVSVCVCDGIVGAGARHVIVLWAERVRSCCSEHAGGSSWDVGRLDLRIVLVLRADSLGLIFWRL